MKKFFTLIVAMVMALPLMATEDTSVTLYEDITGTTCDTSWSGYQQIQATSFTDAKIADLIKVTVSAVGSGTSHLIAFSDPNDSWKMMDGTQWFTITESGTYSFVINSAMLEKLQAGGLIVGGCDYTFTKVELVKRPSKTLKVTNLRNTEFSKDSSWGGDWVSFEAAKFADINEGDQLLVSVKSFTEGSTSGCVALQEASGTSISGQQFDLGTQTLPRVLPFYFTSSLMNTAKEKGIAVTGSTYIGSGVDLVQVVDVVETDTIWKGTQVMPTDWSGNITIAAEKFTGAKVGWTIRLTTGSVGSGAQAEIDDANWNKLEGKEISGRYCKFNIADDATLSVIQSSGLIIKGSGYTLTAVRLFDPETEVKYTSSINIADTEVGKGKDWTWTDTKPVIGLKITNPSATAATVPVEIELTTDKNEAVKTYSQNVDVDANADKEVSFELTDIENPGIYRFTAYVNDEQVSYTRPEDQAYTWTTLNIAYKPTEIVSAADAQADFKEYWDDVKAQLAAIPIMKDASTDMVLVEEGTYRNLYKVTLQSVPNGTSGDPIQIRGYYAEVKAEGTYPTIVNFQGYDSDDTQEVWHPTADSNTTYNELIISARGQSFGNRGDYKADNIYCNTGTEATTDNIAGGKWFTYHFGDKDSYYYRGAYMDQVRGIDFVYSRDKVDKNNIFVTGGSQGGAFTLVATALCGGKVNAIAPAIQFMGDFPDYFQVGNWPGNEAKLAQTWKGMSDDDMYKFLSYYDTKNFASMITAPTLSSIGLQDNVCPAHTNLAPYTNLPSTTEKVLYINKNLVHETPSNNTYSTPNNSSYDWNTLTTNWWTAHMKEPYDPTKDYIDLTQDMTTKWDATYDTTTKTVTWTKDWGGAGWYYGEGTETSPAKDCSAYSKIVYKFAEAAPIAGQIEISYNSGDAGTASFSAGDTGVEYTFDTTRSSQVKQIVIKLGEGAAEKTIKLSSVYFDKTTPEPEPEPTTDVIWSGEQVMPTGWGEYITIDADKFTNAVAGWTLRCMTKDVASGAQAQFGKPSPWTSYENKSFGGRYCDFTLTEAQVNEMKTGGCYVTGCGYTLTAVRLFDPSTQVKYTSSINIADTEVGKGKDWTWTDTKPVIGLKITNPSATAATVPVEIELTTDKNEAVKTYSQNVDVDANADKEVSFTLDDITAPGIYRFTAYVNDEQVSYTRPEDSKYTWTTLNIAYKPTEIVSEPDAQADFKEYWDDVKAQLAAVDMDAQLELVTEGTYRNLYKVTLNSIPNGTSGDPIKIRGYYAEVKAEGTYPTVVNFQGYDSGGTGDLWIPGADDQQDYNTLVISARGQSYGNRDPYKADNIYCNPTDEDKKDFNIKQGWWFTYHFGDKDSYYYRGAYMDQVRGIDFVYSRDKVDKNNIFVTGSSQGGAFTLVATALCGGKVNAIAPAIQFMGDFPDYFQVGNWPVSEAKAAAEMQGMTEEEMYKFLSYYDTKNFASMITAPTLSSIGLQDNVCPAHTNLAPYNLLQVEKELYINKNLVHETPSNNAWSTPNNSSYDWSTLCNEWWAKHIKTPQSAEKGAEAWGTGETYSQTLANGKYGTICLPYNATVKGAVVMDLVNKTAESGVLKSLTFQITGATETESNTLTAGMPYLVRSTAEDGNVTYTRTDTEDAGDVAAVTTANGFTGVYSNTMVAQGDYFLYTDETAGKQYFAPSTGFVQAAPFRAYIKSSDVENIQPKTNAAKAKVVIGFNGTTAINVVNSDYQECREDTCSIRKAMKNGRLVIIKNAENGEKIYINAAGAQLK